jgi:hypothetical protein
MKPPGRQARLDALERRITGPKRVALFGHRAVGKTTLLAMFYREAAAGRVPEVRLAAADAATAEYLADKVASLESGSPPPATLAETELHLRMYHDRAKMPLIVKDYQGEDVALNADDAPIRAFFADCDAVFLCLDADPNADDPDDPAPGAVERLRRQQEIEALLERYLDASADATTARPVALLLTKYDRVLECGGPPPSEVEALAEDLYGMTRHALARHVPRSAIFAVSAYGPGSHHGQVPSELHPMGLDAPLTWLAIQLEAIDRDELEWLWDLAPDDTRRLERCLAAYAQRYPRSERLEFYEESLRQFRSRRRRRRALAALTVFAVGMLSAWVYDAVGFARASAYERTGDRPATAIARRWADFRRWHPFHGFTAPSQARVAEARARHWALESTAETVAAGTAPSAPEVASTLDRIKREDPRLADRVREVEAAQSRARHDEQWLSLEKSAAAPSTAAAPEARLAALRAFLEAFPESVHKPEASTEIARLETEIDARRSQSERQALDSIRREFALPDPDLAAVIESTRSFLSEHPASALRSEAEELLKQATHRVDEAGIQSARNFSRNYPTNFATRRRKYEEYLEAHPQGGAFVREALDALAQIDRDRDTYTYRKAFDHARTYPADIPVIARLLQSYLDTVPDGRFVPAAKQYLEWWARIQSPQDYRVTLLRGRVEPSVGKYFSGGGPDLAVKLWVGGIEYGPSSIAPNSYDPIWNHTFAKPVRWKYGDPVSIRILDHDWSSGGTGIYRINSPKGDPLAMKLLSGTVRPASGGRTELEFRSDFKIPPLPTP